MTFADADPSTGRVTLTRIVGREVRVITLNDELSCGLSSEHALDVIWRAAELVPSLAHREPALVSLMH